MDLNKVIFSEKNILNGSSVVQLVVHDDEGDWQFLSGDNVDEEDAVVISLDQVLKLDPSLSRVLDLPIGKTITRANQEGEWIVR